MNSTEIQRTVRLLRTAMHQQIGKPRKKMDKFLDSYNPLRLNEAIENLK